MNERSHGRLLPAAGLVMAVMLPLSAMAESWQLSAEEWSRPRSGEVVLSMTPVSRAMAAWEGRNDARLELVYPGGERGELWASELKDWLVALGVEADEVRLLPGSGAEDVLILRLR
ncbi:hypothetical protein [Natronospira bacteriovora]|uniref:Uncharacterized protein n=1 Tax=Natronospira bacteriovora TaxID=3069753 RepID=A0ABU0W7G3_9GAMM|nr:hypothetical protein [Natronospira sp. AB-CW4]MDQ2069957.1 hypothetical protein [Natronospira sp. AB-CW4]